MTRHTPEMAGISPGQGAPFISVAPPLGERTPLVEGVAPCASPTPTHGRVIVPLSDSLPRRHQWRVDRVNSAPDAETALRRLFEWARAEDAKVRENRPEDADGFCWQIIHTLTPVVAEMYKSHPAPEFRACPKLPGGGWVPRRPAFRAVEARNP